MKHEMDLSTFDNAQAWYGPDMARRDDWIHELSAPEIAEIDQAVAHAERTGRTILELRRQDFPLERLLPVLSAVRNEALAGRGFFLIRGIPVGRYTLQQSAIAYWGMGMYLGEGVSQNAKGHVLGHVTNLGLDYADPHVRGYQTTVRLPYHCDMSDLVLLLCVKSSRSGGLSSVVSSTTLWNEMVRTRPDHARTLMEPVYFTRWNEIPEGRKPYARVFPFVPWQGRMIGTYVRAAVVKGQQLADVPRLTEEQVAAMDYLDSLAADPEIHLDMAFRPGDIQVLCNHSTFHSRTSFEDWPEPEHRRHLMRLWLACNDGPQLPPFLTQEYQCATEGGRPNGVRVPGSRLVAPVEP
ncbi:MAG TPA: TauD/TfdA family dioxygenase [Ramlibacter sp.]|nr:TauD/TfdA family dioxygenase [Ramlibacter sp.]